MTKEEVIAAIRACAEKLGHLPTRAELKRDTGLTLRQIGLAFGSYTRALAECGLERKGVGKLEIERLFQDWSRVVRKLKKIPHPMPEIKANGSARTSNMRMRALIKPSPSKAGGACFLVGFPSPRSSCR